VRAQREHPGLSSEETEHMYSKNRSV